jgi:hypothetical protein
MQGGDPGGWFTASLQLRSLTVHRVVPAWELLPSVLFIVYVCVACVCVNHSSLLKLSLVKDEGGSVRPHSVPRKGSRSLVGAIVISRVSRDYRP